MPSFDSFSKRDLHHLADRLLEGDAESIERCIAFVEAETFGLWHGRARAMMCRRLKHCQLTKQQGDRLMGAILGRFVAGKFSEQFRDQLRLVLHLDAAQAFEAASANQRAEAEHVRRFSKWILSHKQEK